MRTGGKIRESDVAIHHLGYRDAGIVRRKLLRNGQLLELDAS